MRSSEPVSAPVARAVTVASCPASLRRSHRLPSYVVSVASAPFGFPSGSGRAAEDRCRVAPGPDRVRSKSPSSGTAAWHLVDSFSTTSARSARPPARLTVSRRPCRPELPPDAVVRRSLTSRALHANPSGDLVSQVSRRPKISLGWPARVAWREVVLSAISHGAQGVSLNFPYEFRHAQDVHSLSSGIAPTVPTLSPAPHSQPPPTDPPFP